MDREEAAPRKQARIDWLHRFHEERKAAIDADESLPAHDRDRLKSDLAGWVWDELMATGLFEVVGRVAVENAAGAGSAEFRVGRERERGG